MLQQVLRELYVDPEILCGLDDESKQTLFCKMRAEQIRRWTLWDKKLETDSESPPPPPTHNHNKSRKSVRFLHGCDGEPWVWVMGEHEHDRTIDDILAVEARDKARELAEKEAQQMRQVVEAELKLSDYIEMSTPQVIVESMKIEHHHHHHLEEKDSSIYCSVDELREKMNLSNKPLKTLNNYTISHYTNNNNNKSASKLLDRRDVMSRNATVVKVSQKVELWEKRLTEERTCEIFKKMQRKQREVAKEAEEAEKKQEAMWIEQERKAKEAELQIREIARRAREEHRLINLENDNSSYSTISTPNSTGVPPNRQAVIDWYKSAEVPRKTGLDSTNNPEPWFHGLIARVEAEKLLQEQPEGSYLVRLSERIWGYAISYKARDKCKHYLVHAAPDNYSFLGNNQIEHKTLGDLIKHHIDQPLSGGEKLMNPCPHGDSTLKDLIN